jgi:hypothetical protein
MIIGGVAASVLGRPRSTRDIDALAIVPEDAWPQVLSDAMKAVANRPKDREDIRGLLAAHPDADIAEVRRWVREFATATGMPDMLKELEELLAQRRP